MRVVRFLQTLWSLLSRGVSLVLIAAVKVYQWFISPILGPTCRFYPSCSAYAVESLRVHGPLAGLWLTVRRLLRCHPWNPGGVDDVPPKGAAWRLRTVVDPGQCTAQEQRTSEQRAHL